MKTLLIALTALFLLQSPSAAIQPDEILDDPVLEQRARDISKNLRCVVCQNQSIDDSDAGIAKKMRVQVRERLLQGDSNKEVVDYLVSRYGDFVLLKPPVKTKTLALWFGPAIMVLIGLFGIFVYYRKRSTQTAASTGAAPLSEAEKNRLNALLKEEGKEA